MKYKRIIKKWAKLRHPDKEFATVALRLYETSTESEQKVFLTECQNYINGVRDGIIEPSVPTIPIPVFKKHG